MIRVAVPNLIKTLQYNISNYKKIYKLSDTHANKMNSLEINSDLKYISVVLKNLFETYIVLSFAMTVSRV